MRAVVAALLAGTLLAACERAPLPVAYHDTNQIPERLSEWRVVFADGDAFTLNDGVVPYELNAPLFSDYALKLRTVWMPEGRSAIYNDEREFDFPVGTIISKTFHYEKAPGWSAARPVVLKTDRESALDDAGRLDLGDYLLVETRLLVRHDDGWAAYPYVWNKEQSEATLELAGDIRPLTLSDAAGANDIAYIVPDQNQCANCHTPDHTSKALRPLGPKARQLNREYGWWGEDGSQLEHWARSGLLAGFDGAAPSLPRWSRPADATLEDLARSYLDANCAHCHNPAGAADTSALHLNIDAPLDRLYGICKTPVAVGRGSGDRPVDIYPGRPGDSILVYRMQESDPAIAMPELGRSVAHAEGVRVVSDWIAAMNGDCNVRSNDERE